MDLSKVTFPTFVLEPRSMLERITDFMSHPDLLFGQVPSVLYLISPDLLTCRPSPPRHAHPDLTPHPTQPALLAPCYRTDRAENCDDPEERFIRVLQYYLAGWHIKPKGVKKPCVRLRAPRACPPSRRSLTPRLPAQLQPRPRRVLPLSVRLRRRLARLLHRRARCVLSRPVHPYPCSATPRRAPVAAPGVVLCSGR